MSIKDLLIETLNQQDPGPSQDEEQLDEMLKNKYLDLSLEKIQRRIFVTTTELRDAEAAIRNTMMGGHGDRNAAVKERNDLEARLKELRAAERIKKQQSK